MDDCNCMPKLEAIEREIKDIKKREEKTQERLLVIEQDRRLNSFQFENIMQSINEIKIKMEEITNAPAKTWQTVVTTVITVVITYAVTRFLG